MQSILPSQNSIISFSRVGTEGSTIPNPFVRSSAPSSLAPTQAGNPQGSLGKSSAASRPSRLLFLGLPLHVLEAACVGSGLPKTPHPLEAACELQQQGNQLERAENAGCCFSGRARPRWHRPRFACRRSQAEPAPRVSPRLESKDPCWKALERGCPSVQI